MTGKSGIRCWSSLMGLLAAVALASGCGNGGGKCDDVENPCQTEGAMRCSEDDTAIETCTVNADGCLAWVASDCAAGTVCDDSGAEPECVATCEDECDPAEYPACSADDSAIETCEEQADGCYDLISVDCGADEVCDDSGAEPECVCSDECDPADYPVCNEDDTAVLSCEQADDGCYDVVTTDCGADQVCDDSGDTTECVDQCVNECDPADYPACADNGYAIETCEMQDDGCTDLVVTECEAGQTCDPDTVSCVDSGCSDDCDPADYPACNPNGLAVDSCERQADGCYDVVTTDCAHGQVCNPDTAACEDSGCADDCDPADYPVCSADNTAVETCAVGEDGCYDVVSTDCVADEVCAGAAGEAACVCTDECDPVDYPACSQDLSAVETCEQQEDGCYDVVSTDCPADEVCDPDTAECVLACEHECDPADYPVCNADNSGVETCEEQADGCYDIIDNPCDFGQACVDADAECQPDPNCEQRVADGSFEGGTPNPDWEEASTAFGTPICSVASCGDAGGIAAPRTGDFFVWFGGVDDQETGSVAQQVRIPTGASARLSFYLDMISSADTAEDVITVTMDGDELFSADSTDAAAYSGYTLVEVDVSAYNDGAAHQLVLSSVTTGANPDGDLSNFLVEDISLLACDGVCVNECDVLDALTCSPDATELWICTENATDNCNDWLLDTDCAADQQECDDTLDPPSCVACSDECPAEGDTRCAAGWVETCAPGPDTCLDWEQTADCSAVGYCDDSSDPAVCAPYNEASGGDTCDDGALVPLSIPAQLPARALEQTTCGAGDDYSGTCMDPYDSGEDFLYQLDATERTIVNIIVDPKDTGWTGIGVDDACPPAAEGCVIAGGVYDAAPYQTGCFALEAGLYTVMIDTYAEPDCIPEYDIWFEQCECLPGEMQCVDATTLAVCNERGMWERTECADGCAELSPDTFGCYYTPAAAGDLVITEIMQNPAAVDDNIGEWFELFNATDEYVNLNGLTFQDDGTDTFTVAADVIAAPGSYLVLGISDVPADNGGVPVDFAYADAMILANGSDEVEILAADNTSIDRVAYDDGATFPDPTGAAMALDPAVLPDGDNNDGGNWCTALLPYGDGDLGSPGEANLSCDYTAIALEEDLEADPGWSIPADSDWVWGAPDPDALPEGPAACAGGSAGCLGTGMDADYGNNASPDVDHVVFGPVDLSGATSAALLFDMWLNMESGWDYAMVQVSTDGSTFVALPMTSPAYNEGDAWTGTLGGPAWQPAVGDLSGFVGGDVWIRFAIESDVSAGRPGFYVDNVMILE